MYGGQENNDNVYSKKTKEKSTLIPLTVKMFKESTILPGDQIEYKGIALSEVKFVGHLLDYKEDGIRVIVTIGDLTGSHEIIFFNKNESESSAGLQNFDPKQ